MLQPIITVDASDPDKRRIYITGPDNPANFGDDIVSYIETCGPLIAIARTTTKYVIVVKPGLDLKEVWIYLKSLGELMQVSTDMDTLTQTEIDPSNPGPGSLESLKPDNELIEG